MFWFSGCVNISPGGEVFSPMRAKVRAQLLNLRMSQPPRIVVSIFRSYYRFRFFFVALVDINVSRW